MSTTTFPMEQACGIEHQLTSREYEFVRLVGDGLSNREIASALGCTEQGTKQRIHTIYTKLGCKNRVDLALRYEREQRGEILAPASALPTHTELGADSRAMRATSYNFRNCEACGHSLRNQLPELGAQIWSCSECGLNRQWGLLSAEDRKFRAALHCDQCACVTRHCYVGVIGGLA